MKQPHEYNAPGPSVMFVVNSSHPMAIGDSLSAHARFRALLLVIVLLFLLLLIGAFVAVRNRSQQPASAPQPSSDIAATAAATPGLPAPSVLNTYAGTVASASSKTIVFSATVYDAASGRYAQRDLTAELSSATVFRTPAVGKPAPPLPGQPASSQYVTISRSDLRRGDNIQVFSGENIAGRQSFPVTEVRRLAH